MKKTQYQVREGKMKLNIQEIGISLLVDMSKNGGDMRWWKVGVMTRRWKVIMHIGSSLRWDCRTS
jgi:hypothetical protein